MILSRTVRIWTWHTLAPTIRCLLRQLLVVLIILTAKGYKLGSTKGYRTGSHSEDELLFSRPEYSENDDDGGKDGKLKMLKGCKRLRHTYRL